MTYDISPTGLLKTTEQVRHHQLHDVQSAPVCVCVCVRVVILVSGTCHAVILPGGGSASLTVIPSITVFMFLQLVVLSSDQRTLLLLLMSLPITPPSPPLPAAPCLISGAPSQHKMTLDFVFVAVFVGGDLSKRPKWRLSGQWNSRWWSLSSVYERLPWGLRDTKTHRTHILCGTAGTTGFSPVVTPGTARKRILAPKKDLSMYCSTEVITVLIKTLLIKNVQDKFKP